MIKRTKASRKGRYAFTLVELLVVVAIIALLVSILLPTLGRAKEQARRVVCASNLRNCGIALHSYSTDNAGRFPPSISGEGWGFQANLYYYHPTRHDLREYLMPHMGEGFGSWECPAIAKFRFYPYPVPNDFSGYPYGYCTYYYLPGRKWPQFARPGDEQYSNPKVQPDREHLVDVAAEQVILQDTLIDDWMTTGSMKYNHGPGDPQPGWILRFGARGDGANLLFYDGHAKWHSLDNLEPVGYIIGAAYHDVLAWSVLP